MSEPLERLFVSVEAARRRDPAVSRTARLFREGAPKIARKLIEEALELGLDAVQGNRESAILESADLLYHLAIVWAECGITPAEVAREIERRERLYGIAEKLSKEASAAEARRLAAPATRRKPLA